MRATKPLVGWFVAIGMIGLGLSCGRSGPPPVAGPVVLDEEAPAEAVDRARKTADALANEVVTTLFRELEGGNAIDAIDVCSVKAGEFAAAFSVDGLTVRRVSERFRNPADEPDAYEYRRLAELQRMHDQGQLPAESIQVVREDGQKSLRYLKPLLIKQPCMMCHGPVGQVAPEVMDAIRERYPGDTAIGYELDDLRGAISVTVQL